MAEDKTIEIAAQPDFARLRVESVEVRNFRGIKHCKLELEPGVTLLVGPNNSGKSRLLRALAIALGGVTVEADDLTQTSGEPIPATIDIVLAPSPPEQSGEDDVVDDFFAIPEGPLLESLYSVSQDPERERFSWRTTITPSAEGLKVRSESRVRRFDDSELAWVASPTDGALTRDQWQLFTAVYVSEQRDIDRELTARGSTIRRILSDLDLAHEDREQIEAELSQLGQLVLSKSDTLARVKGSLDDARDAIGAIGTPGVSAIPATAEELARSVDITLDTGAGGIPSRFHGSGARSLASMQVQTLLYQLRTGRDGSNLLPHPVTMLEEPEVHLDPIAQFELPALLGQFDGQLVASTHSSHLVTTADHRSVRVLRDRADHIEVISLAPTSAPINDPKIYQDDRHLDAVEKLKSHVERPFGELLFATALVIGDGVTERTFLPPLLRHALGSDCYGLCVIDPGSMGSPLAHAAGRFANLIDIPLFLFCDGDEAGVTDLANFKTEVTIDADSQVVIMDGAATEKMMLAHDSAMCERAVAAVRPDLDGPIESTIRKTKGSIGPFLAHELIEASPNYQDWPTPLVQLVNLVRAEFARRAKPAS